MMWLKNSSDKPDAMLTFSAIAFLVVLVKFLASGVSTKIHDNDVNFGQVDAASISALLIPTLGSYVARRHSDVKYGDKPPTDPDADEPAHDPKG